MNDYKIIWLDCSERMLVGLVSEIIFEEEIH